MIKGLTSGWCPGNVLGSDHPWLVARFQRWIVLNYFYFDIFGYFVVLGFQRFNQYQWGKIYGHPLRSLGWWKTGPIPGVPGCDLEPEECYWELAQNADGKSVLIHLQKTLGTAWPRRRVWKGNWAQEFRLRSWVGPFNIGGGLLAFFPAPFDRESWFARFCSFSVLAPAIPFLCNSYRPTSPYYWPRHAHTHFFHMKVEKRWTEINRDEKRWKEYIQTFWNGWGLGTYHFKELWTFCMCEFLWPCWFDMVWYWILRSDALQPRKGSVTARWPQSLFKEGWLAWHFSYILAACSSEKKDGFLGVPVWTSTEESRQTITTIGWGPWNKIEDAANKLGCYKPTNALGVRRRSKLQLGRIRWMYNVGCYIPYETRVIKLGNGQWPNDRWCFNENLHLDFRHDFP